MGFNGEERSFANMKNKLIKRIVKNFVDTCDLYYKAYGNY